MVDMSDELSEERRLEIIRGLQDAARRDGFPDIDIDSLVAGDLAGPASTDRPPVPVWEYLDYAVEHPGVSIEELSKVRFPILFHCEGSMVTSIAEHTAPGPVPPRLVVTADDVVRLYALMHEAGAMQWNAETRTIEEVKPRYSYAPAIYEKWASQLERPSE
jgi:hypothetical protein